MVTENANMVPGTFDGYLMQWLGDGDRASDTLAASLLSELLKIPELKMRQISLPRGWHAFDVETEFPLHPVTEQNRMPVYTYFLIVRIQSITGSVIVASTSRMVTKGILDQIINIQIRPNILPIQILVGDLSKDLVFGEAAPFNMTSFYGDFIHDGADVRTMILYGDDLGNSKFVKDNIGSVSVNQVGMRERSSLREDARIGAGGSLRFYYREGSGLVSLEACLSFVNAKKFYIYPAG